MSLSTAIWWIRRDLRLFDNQALTEAISAADYVIPVFILDPNLIHSPNTSHKRMEFLYRGLADLDAKLRMKGSQLVIKRGAPVEVLAKLLKQSGANQLFAEEDFSPYARRRDNQVASELPLKLVGGSCVSHPKSIKNKDGKPYKVFSPYMRAWKAHYPIGADRLAPIPQFVPTPSEITSERFPDVPALDQEATFNPGEIVAKRRLQEFMHSETQGIYSYADSRDFMSIPGTAQISPYLRFGMLSARQCVSAAQQAMQDACDGQSRQSAEIWLNELIWREFYISILFHFPHVLKHSFQEDLRAIPWRNEPAEYLAWCEGQTGYPIVDAAMRQLLNTGWMHNRGRMIVASFLVKHLLIDWRWGERWFMQHLIDGDPAANNGGWQWSAGTGTDAAPYFRVFNPIIQSKKYDPDGNFIRQWIPDLEAVPRKYIHTPWEMPDEMQQRIGCVIGVNYPHPVVEHRFARERVLDVYRKAKLANRQQG
jgi:deoxyribodipyrimidine photo-lyase